MKQKFFQFHADNNDFRLDSEIAPVGSEYVMKNAEGTVLSRWILEDGNRTYTVENKKTSNGEWKLSEGQTYWIEERIVLADGSRVKIGIISVQLDSHAQVTSVDCINQETKTEISKIALTTGEELPGAVLTIKDEQGVVIDEWTSSTEKHLIKGLLEAGKTYVLSERYAADGYAYAEEIHFTIHEDGGITEIVMEDRPTKVEIRKIDMTTGEELPGAELALRDSNGKLVDQWISGKDAHVISGRLIAGEVYTLQEIAAPNGYRLAEEITFTVSLDGTIDRVVMENRRYENDENPTEEPEEPKHPDKEKRYGTIIAKYSPELSDTGVLYIGNPEKQAIMGVPETGDHPFPWNLMSGAILSVFGCMILLIAERNERKHERKLERKVD